MTVKEMIKAVSEGADAKRTARKNLRSRIGGALRRTGRMLKKDAKSLTKNSLAHAAVGGVAGYYAAGAVGKGLNHWANKQLAKREK